jgi:hypothetical protein
MLLSLVLYVRTGTKFVTPLDLNPSIDVMQTASSSLAAPFPPSINSTLDSEILAPQMAPSLAALENKTAPPKQCSLAGQEGLCEPEPATAM